METVQKNRLVFMFNKIVILTLLFSFSFISDIYSQCCSAGSPVGASIYIGILEKSSLRVNSFYRHSQNVYYFEGTEKLPDYGNFKFTRFDYASLSVGYGLLKRLSLEFETGYFLDKTREMKNIDYTQIGRGFSNGNFTFKYCPYKSIPKEIEITIGGGLKFPFSDEISNDINHPNVVLSYDLQPSTHSYGASFNFFATKNYPSHSRRFFTNNRFEYNFVNPQSYQYGWILSNSLFVSNKLFKNCFAVIEARSEYRGVDKIIDDNNETLELTDRTGGHLVIISPRILYSIASKWNLSLLYDIPVYRYYNGKQMALDYSFALSLSRDFSLKKKE